MTVFSAMVGAVIVSPHGQLEANLRVTENFLSMKLVSMSIYRCRHTAGSPVAARETPIMMHAAYSLQSFGYFQRGG